MTKKLIQYRFEDMELITVVVFGRDVEVFWPRHLSDSVTLLPEPSVSPNPDGFDAPTA